MSTIDGIEAVTTRALELALDAASMRQQAIASNIANASVSGYVPVRVNFEEQLEEARQSIAARGTLDLASLSGVSPQLRWDAESALPGGSPKVELDAEVARLAQNGVQYQALVTGLAKHFAILASAVGDGRK